LDNYIAAYCFYHISVHLLSILHATWFLRTRWVACWQPWICMSRF